MTEAVLVPGTQHDVHRASSGNPVLAVDVDPVVFFRGLKARGEGASPRAHRGTAANTQGLVVRWHHPDNMITASNNLPGRAIQVNQTYPFHAVNIEMHDAQHRRLRSTAIHEHAVVTELVERGVHGVEPLSGRPSLREF